MITHSQSANTAADAAANPPVNPARALLRELHEKYTVFNQHLPLAIGIDKQLVAQRPDIQRKVLRIALGIHTNSLRYLKGFEKASVRFSLDGSQADEVTEPQRSHASQLIRERSKKHAEQRKAQVEADRTALVAAKAAQEAEEEARLRADKLNQLTAKFARNGRA